MKINLLAILMLIVTTTDAFSGEPVYCSGKGYRGYIFDSSHFVLKSIEHQEKRYTPTTDDVKKAEHVLKEKLKGVNIERINQLDDCPIVHKNLKKYCRQYVGFINEKGQRIIWVNLFWNKEVEKQAKEGIVVVQDGCSYFWNIEINIDSENLINLQVNGSA